MRRDHSPPLTAARWIVVVAAAAAAATTTGASRSARADDGDVPVIRAPASDVAPESGARPTPRLKLSIDGFHIGSPTEGSVPLNGVRLDFYPLSDPWLRAGLGLEAGLGRATISGADVSADYGLLGVSLGAQYPARVTPFVEGQFSGGFLSGRLNGPLTVSGITVDNAAGTTWLLAGGLSAGAEFYVFDRFYVSPSIGWLRTGWASPTYDSSGRSQGLTQITADSFIWRLGVGL